MNQRELQPGIAKFLIEVSQNLPEPQTQAGGDAALVGGGGRPPVAVATDFGDRENRPNPDAAEWARKFTAYWTTAAPIEDMEEIDREMHGERSFEANLARTFWGEQTETDALIGEWTHEMDEILENTHLCEPGKTFLKTIFHDMTVAGRATAEVIDFDKLDLDPVLMFTGIPEHTRFADEALFELHGRIIHTAEKQLAADTNKEEYQIDSYWTVDAQFLTEQLQLHAQWAQALREDRKT